MFKNKKFQSGYSKLTIEEKYILILLVIKYWKENGFKINSCKRIYPSDINFNDIEDLILEINFINTVKNYKLNKIYYLFLEIKDFYKIDFIVNEFLILSNYNVINLKYKNEFLDYAYKLIKIQKTMLLNNCI